TAPQRWVDSGVFARMRQANYSGEILFQLGLMLAVVGTARDWREYLLCWIGPLYVCILMVFQSQMLDRSQLARYGADPQYRAWRERSGRLLPF
ncbi:MAG: DUF1295 domain-containing protein, partial [Steroidobacteraceae bacterium]|nr:DUF1295 domain-containing protein [Steroidobacteraceae bacterium]MDW8259372.1 DUF1295 domain-containing protein [Gammaproteobacteria bacterium]